MSVVEQPVGGGGLAMTPVRGRIPEWTVNPVAGWLWLLAEATIVITGLWPLLVFRVGAAILIVFDHPRRGRAIAWGAATIVLGSVAYIPYSYLRRRREPPLEAFGSSWRMPDTSPPSVSLGPVTLAKPQVNWTSVGLGLLFLGVAAAYPYVIPEILGSSGDDLLDASVNSLAYIIMALGLNIVVGFAGLLDLGYVAFFAIGAFVMGWLGSGQFADASVHIGVSEFTSNLPGIHVNFVLVVVGAALFTAIWGAILGAPTLRLRGDYLAIVTLAFGEIVPRVFENSTSGPFGIGSLDISNGRQGITPVDKIYFPGIGTLDYPLSLTGIYFVALVMLLVTLFVNLRLRDSRLGRAWIAVREDEVAAASMGVNLVRTKLWAYAMGAAFGGFSGAFLATYKNTVNVDQFEFGFSVFILCMVIIGGMGNTWGVILGAIALSMVDRYVLAELNTLSQDLDLGVDVTAVNFGIFGFFLLIMMVLRPEGFLPSRRRKLELEGEVAEEALYEVRH